MLIESIDEQSGIVVWVHAIPYGPADFDNHRVCLEQIVSNRTLAARMLGVLVTEPDSPGPPATHRRAIHDVLVKVPATARALIVSANPLTRGTVTALSWLGVIPFPIHSFRTWDDALVSRALDADVRRRCELARQMYEDMLVG